MPYHDSSGQTNLQSYQIKQAEAYCDEFTAYNMGAEFFQWQIGHYFDFRRLKEYDVSTVVNMLKAMECESGKILNEKNCQLKFRFYPIETHQALCFLGLRDACLSSERGGDPFKNNEGYKPEKGTKKAEIEFNQPNI